MQARRHDGRPPEGDAFAPDGSTATGSPSLCILLRRAGPCAHAALAHARRGRVASVHARAINVILETGPVLTILPDGTPVHPWALVADVAAPRFASLGTALKDDVVHIDAQVLRAGPCAFDFTTAEVVELRLRNCRAAVPAAAVQVLARAAATGSRSGAFDATLDAVLGEFTRGAPVEDLAGRLVGLGEGFTPAGDDALVGILAGLDVASRTQTAAGALRAALVAALPSPLGARTTQTAAQMVAAAADGLYAEPVLHVLEALCEAEEFGPDHAALRALAQMGARSGVDTLRGLVAAVVRSAAPTRL
jgi:hypothetical protein